MAVAVDGANRHDMELVEATLHALVVAPPVPTAEAPQHLCLDKGDDYEAVRATLDEWGYTAHILRACARSPRTPQASTLAPMSSSRAGPTARTSRSCAPLARTPRLSTTLADWCVDRGIQTVAMASTGVYWMPLCEALEARGLQCCLISAQSITRVPGPPE